MKLTINETEILDNYTSIISVDDCHFLKVVDNKLRPTTQFESDTIDKLIKLKLIKPSLDCHVKSYIKVEPCMSTHSKNGAPIIEKSYSHN